MALFVKVTDPNTSAPFWVNLDHVRSMAAGEGGSSYLWPSGVHGAEVIHVVEAPEEILALADPDAILALADPDACPDPTCGYDEYLARGDGSGDLSHRGWHGAMEAFTRHNGMCRRIERTGICSICADHERRIRA